MHKVTVTALTISGLTALGVYRYRRGLVSRLLGLPPALHDVAVERGLRIPMRDGAELVADRYYPRESGRFPTILVCTPYGRKASGFFVSRRMAERGYNVLVQDVRGRFDSEGEFDVFAGEDVDGWATIGWISNQPWFDGSLGLWGMSYLAYAQWAAAPGAPTFLRAIMPQIGGSRAYPIIYPDGAFNLDLALPIPSSSRNRTLNRMPRSSRACFRNSGFGVGSGAVLCTCLSAKQTRRSRAVRRPFSATGWLTRKPTPTGGIGTTAAGYARWKPPRTCSPAGMTSSCASCWTTTRP